MVFYALQGQDATFILKRCCFYVFADDAMGGDPGCPAPVLPSLREVGKNGRAVDLKEYITMKELKR